MIVLTKSECLAARHVVQDAAEHKELDAPSASMLLGIIHDRIEAIKIAPILLMSLEDA